MSGPMNNDGVGGVVREAWNTGNKPKKSKDEKFPVKQTGQPTGRMAMMMPKKGQ